MFTGLIETTGRIERFDDRAGGRRLHVGASFANELQPGDSVAVNGVCLTVVETKSGTFTADLSRTTLEVTSLGTVDTGRLVNLERPVRADSRMGGHFVLGHVDETSTIRRFDRDGDGYWLEVEIPANLTAFVIPKGSIAIDGISLTVATLRDRLVGVQIVPFTFAHTSLREAKAGDAVNLETDMLGKYVVRLLERQPL